MSTPELGNMTPEQKRELLKQLMAKAAAGRENISPLSLAQEGLWLSHLFNPDGFSDHLMNAYEIVGELDQPALERALLELVARHESLRTSFAIRDEKPVQVIKTSLEPQWIRVDLSAEAAERREQLAHERLIAETRRVFDLVEGPLFRIALIRLDEKRIILGLILHHIVADNSTFRILNDELSRLYAAFHAGKPSPLPAPLCQFREVVRAQKERLGEAELARQLSYWKIELAGLEPTTIEPDFPRPKVQSFRGRKYEHMLPFGTATRLTKLAVANDASFFAAQLALFQVLVHRVTGAQDLSIGSPFANRNGTRDAATVGFFPNTLIIRANFEDAPSFNSLLARTRDKLFGALENGEVPFDRVVDAVGFPRDPSRNPMAPMVLQVGMLPELNLANLNVTKRFEGDYGIVRVDLELYLVNEIDGYRAIFLYNEDLYRQERIAQLARLLERVICAVIEQPERPVNSFSLCSAEESELLLGAWNDSARDFGPASCLHRLFEECAEKYPNELALQARDRKLSYAELDQRATQMALRLRRAGVHPETLVGIALPRDLDYIVAILAIWKAGGAYLPLDPKYPADRIAYLLEDSGSHLVITSRELQAHFASIHCYFPEETYEILDERLPHAAQPANLAYLIYTSGTTGKPKGVAICHATAVNYFRFFCGAYPLKPGETLMQTLSFSFDASISSIFHPLFSGAILDLSAPEGAEGIGELRYWTEKHRASAFALTPSALKLFAEEPGLEKLSHLRMLFIGGELTQPSLIQRFQQAIACQFVAVYGPTEATICVSCWSAPKELPAWVPMGAPNANVQLHVCDAAFHLAPPGLPGELLIGGNCLARGYQGRPELSAEKFVPNPFGPPGSRLYRSGDLVVRNPDGSLRFLGRVDKQVKVRGFRIELGEIESEIRSRAEVAHAAVIALSDALGRKRLVAYVVPRGEQASDWSEALAAWLGTRLPEYMVPSAFVSLAALPFTPSGKINERALPSPDLDAGRASFVAPRSPAELLLAKIWAEVLGLKEVGRHDQFFMLGGDSILAIQVVSRANRAGLRLKPRQIFQAKDLAALAELATGGDEQTDNAPVHGPVPLLPIQHWYLEQQRRNPELFSQILTLESHLPLPESELRQALDLLLARHDGLRLRFRHGENGWEQGYETGSGSAHFPISRHDLSGAKDLKAEQARLIESAARQLDLARGPLAKALLLERGSELKPQLVLLIHHLVIDGVSWRILLEELSLIRDALAAGNKPELGFRPCSLQAWSQQLQTHARASETLKEWDYWRNRPEGAGLQADQPEAANLVAGETDLVLELDAQSTQALLVDAHQAHGTRVQELLLAALARVLAQECGSDRVELQLEGHGREALFEQLDPSRTIGWFTSSFPVTLCAPPSASWDQVVISVKESLRQLPRNGIGYGLLRYLNRESAAQLAQRPEPGLVFNYLGQFDSFLPQGSAFSLAADGFGGLLDPNGPRLSDWDLYALIRDGKLQIHWRFQPQRFESARMRRLAEAYRDALQALVAHCSGARRSWSPSDFPLAELDATRLEALVRDYPDLEDLYPLTPMQQGMIFNSLMNQEEQRYIQQLSCRLKGKLDSQRFHEAWQATMDRHPIARTLFLLETSKPLQVVTACCALEWRTLDWRDLPERTIAAQLSLIEKEESGKGFEWARRSPQRMCLILLPDERFHFIWTHHHALFDGWSFPITLREVCEQYAARMEERAPLLEPVYPYRAHVAWLLQADHAAARAFWKSRLGDFDAPNQLQLGSHADAKGAQHGNSDLTLSRQASAALHNFSRTHGLTLSTLVQGAWAQLIGRYSSSQDVVFGVTTSGRSAEVAHSEQMVGLFINTLPARVKLRFEGSLLDWLRQIQANHGEALAHEATPLHEAQSQSGVPAGNALFETIVVYENYPSADALRHMWAGAELEDIQAVERVEYALVLQVVPGDQMVFRFKYDPRRFSESAIQRMQRHFSQLLEAIQQHPELAPSQLDLLNSAERLQLTLGLNDTNLAYSETRCMHQLFEAQVIKTPDLPACRDENSWLSYDQLNRRANRLAHFLIERGVRPGDLVGVCFRRRVDLVVGVMAVLKSGAAYVPADPIFPAERVHYIMESSGARVFLSHRELIERNGESKIPNFALDELPLEGYPENNPDLELDSNSLSYIIFTSGSTGRPKGVMLQHRPVVNLLEWVNQTYKVGPGDRLLFVTSLCFDLSVYDIFGSLACGSEIYIASDEDIKNADALARILQEREISFWDSAPAALQQLVPLFPPAGSGSQKLRLVFLSGDWVPLGLPPALKTSFPKVEVVALGGATEAAIWSNFFQVAEILPHWTSVPYGKPIQNAHYHVLDRQLRPCPIGVPGDLYIGDKCLSLGYFDQPELTAERYIPNPYATDPRYAVLYTTGDRARRMEDGNIEFLGRLDAQVKIRGYRIELGEIEALMQEQPGIKIAIAQVRTLGAGNRVIVCYYIPAGQPDEDAIRENLKQRLPEYMLPHALVAMPAFPVTANGKLDYKSLPDPEEKRGEAGADAEQLQGTQAKIAAIWCEVLKLERVGAGDNFFDLGGHSLLVTQVSSRIDAHLGVKISVRLVFEKAVLRELAAAVDALLGESQPEKELVPALVAAERSGALPLSFAQERLWFLYQLEPDSPFYNMFLPLRLRGPLDLQALQLALSELYQRHEVLRTALELRNGELFQVVQDPQPIRLQVEAFAGEEAEWKALIQAELMQPFDLLRQPQPRLRLLRLATDDHIFTFAIHHIFFDGWSLGVFFQELGQLYSHYAAGAKERSALPVPPLQYGDFTLWQHRFFDAERLRRNYAFWEAQLKQAPFFLPLPYDFERPDRQTYNGRMAQFLIDRDTSDKLHALCNAKGASLFMALLAGFQVLLRWFSGKDDFLIGTDIANRNRGELEGLLGFFVNQLVLRSKLEGDPSFETLVERAKTTTLAAYEYQDLPFHKLVEHFNPARGNYAPIFQTKIVLQNAPIGALKIPGLDIQVVFPERQNAQTDLLLVLSECEDGIQGGFEYNSDLFMAATIERLIEQYGLLLRSAANQGGKSLHQLLEELESNALERERQAREQARSNRRIRRPGGR